MKSLCINLFFIISVKLYYIYEVFNTKINLFNTVLTSKYIKEIDPIIFMIDLGLFIVPTLVFNKYLKDIYITTYPYVRTRKTLKELYIKEKVYSGVIIAVVLITTLIFSLITKDINLKVISYIISIIYFSFVNYRILLSYFNKSIADVINFLLLLITYAMFTLYDEVLIGVLLVTIILEIVLVMNYKRRFPYDRNN